MRMIRPSRNIRSVIVAKSFRESRIFHANGPARLVRSLGPKAPSSRVSPAPQREAACLIAHGAQLGVPVLVVDLLLGPLRDRRNVNDRRLSRRDPRDPRSPRNNTSPTSHRSRTSRTTHRSAIRFGYRPSHPVPSHLGPLAVGLRRLAQHKQVPEQHDGRRHDHPPGRHLGARQPARRNAQRHEHQQQPPPRRQHPPVGRINRPRRNLIGHASRTGKHGSSAPLRRRIHPPPRRRCRCRCRCRRRYRCRLRLSGRIIRGPRRTGRRSLGIGRGNRRVPPQPPGNEHDGPDDDDRDVKDRATQQSSPRGTLGTRRTSGTGGTWSRADCSRRACLRDAT